MKKLSTANQSIESRIAEERLREAQWSYNLAHAATMISFLIGVVGALLLLSGKITEGAVTTSGGLGF